MVEPTRASRSVNSIASADAMIAIRGEIDRVRR
jgi:hypothetical protein